MERVIREINSLLGFYSVGMESAKQSKNFEKYYQFLEAYEALGILKDRLKISEKVA